MSLRCCREGKEVRKIGPLLPRCDLHLQRSLAAVTGNVKKIVILLLSLAGLGGMAALPMAGRACRQKRAPFLHGSCEALWETSKPARRWRTAQTAHPGIDDLLKSEICRFVGNVGGSDITRPRGRSKADHSIIRSRVVQRFHTCSATCAACVRCLSHS